MCYLVTGGTGFLGGHLVRALLARGDQVVALGRNNERCVALGRSGALVVRCELSDQVATAKSFAGVHTVFHVAGLSAPWGPYRKFYEANVAATRNVVQAALVRGVRRLVFVSSPSVTFDPRDESESDETKPYTQRFLSPYQATKKLAEDVVNTARADLECVIVRPKAIFGPGDRTLMPRLIQAAKSGKLLQLGDGSNRVDLTYVGNVVDALLEAAESRKSPGNTYLITNGEHVLLWPLLRRMLAAAGCDTHLRTVSRTIAYALATISEWTSRVSNLEPPLTRYAVALLTRSQTYSIAAARRDVNYNPRISIDTAVEMTLPYLNSSDNS